MFRADFNMFSIADITILKTTGRGASNKTMSAGEGCMLAEVDKSSPRPANGLRGASISFQLHQNLVNPLWKHISLRNFMPLLSMSQSQPSYLSLLDAKLQLQARCLG